MEKFIISLFQVAFALVEIFVMVAGTFVAMLMGKEEEFAENVKGYNEGKRQAQQEQLAKQRQQELHEAHLAALRAQQHRHGVGHAIMHKAGEEVVGHVLKHILK